VAERNESRMDKRKQEHKMRILFYIASLGLGGAERVVCILANALATKGYEVHIGLVVNRNVLYELSDDVNVHFMDCEKDMHMNAANRYFYRVQKIKRLAKTVKPCVAISFMAETNIDVCMAMLGLNIPLIVSERNDPAVDPASRIKQMMRRFLYVRPRGFVFQTPDAQAYFSKSIRDRSVIILNPLSDNLPARKNSNDEKRIVSACRLDKQKNLPLMIDAFQVFVSKHPEYSLEIYGDGKLKDQLKRLIEDKKLNDKIKLMGYCADVHNKVADASMFVLTSDYEGMPNALLEAMAMGIPCISTDCPCGGPRMLMEDGKKGILIPVGDKQELVNAMLFYAENPQEAEKYGLNARQIKEMADRECVVSQWETYINVCINR